MSIISADPLHAYGGQFITTIKPGEKVGARMDRKAYEQIKLFMVELLNTEGSVTINQLVEKCCDHFAADFKEETGWYVYNVKLDLEARGLIVKKSLQRKSKRIINHQLSTIELKMSNKSKGRQMENSSPAPNAHLGEKFFEMFSKKPLMVHAPGRINLIGEHTDYNNGFVMPVSIDKGVQFALATSKNANSLIYSVKYKEFLSVDMNSLDRVKGSGWQNYFLGILFKLKAIGHIIPPFDCVFEGDLPTGAGLSSSAALECGFVVALNSLFDFGLTKRTMIEIAQWSEHNYVGVKCGIMDQFTSILGREGHALLLDCKTLHYEYLPLQLGDHCLLLCDTNVKHSLASSEYNTRREECEAGVRILKERFPQVMSLRDVNIEMLLECQHLLDQKIFNRCKYVIDENDRVIAASENLKSGDLRSLGVKMYQTHNGLSRLYEVSCPELDFLVEYASQFEEILGSRMMGGGFGGCTINIIQSGFVGSFINQVEKAYKEQFGFYPAFHVVKTGDGATVLNSEFVNYSVL